MPYETNEELSFYGVIKWECYDYGFSPWPEVFPTLEAAREFVISGLVFSAGISSWKEIKPNLWALGFRRVAIFPYGVAGESQKQERESDFFADPLLTLEQES